MIVIVLAIIAISSVIGYIVLKDVNDDMQSDTEISEQSKAVMQQTTSDYPDLMDNAFVFILGLMWVLAIVASFFIDANPIFLILAIVILIVVIFVGLSISATHAEFMDDDEVRTDAASFPKTNWIMDHLVYVILAIASTILIALYGKQYVI